MIVFKNRFAVKIRISCPLPSVEFCKVMFIDCNMISAKTAFCDENVCNKTPNPRFSTELTLSHRFVVKIKLMTTEIKDASHVYDSRLCHQTPSSLPLRVLLALFLYFLRMARKCIRDILIMFYFEIQS